MFIQMALAQLKKKSEEKKSKEGSKYFAILKKEKKSNLKYLYKIDFY